MAGETRPGVPERVRAPRSDGPRLFAIVADGVRWRDHALAGSPDMIVGRFARLEAAGVDGVQVNFYDFGPDLDRFARTVLPLMHEAGLQNPEPAGHDMGSAA